MTSDRLETLILYALFNNDSYTRQVLPFLKTEYFEVHSESVLFDNIEKFILTYNNLPTKEAIAIQVGENKTYSQSVVGEIKKLLSEINYDEKTDVKWLFDQTEKWCKKQAFVCGLKSCIGLLEDKSVDLGTAPKLMQDAISISFNPSIGHDYFEDSEARWEFYSQKEEKIPFSLDYFNRITRGGVSKKTLNCIMAAAGIGKSIFLCSSAADNLLIGKNVLYITLEMRKEHIAQRIDANLLDVAIDQFETIDKRHFLDKLENLRRKTAGQLVVEEFPMASANTNHFRRLLDDLWLKKRFAPDVVYIDYLGIMASSRMKMGAGINSYSFYGAIAQEVRGLATERDIPIFSAVQLNRGGYKKADAEMEDTAESMGFVHVFDLFFSLHTNPELESLHQMVVKQLKNRYNDVFNPVKFLIGLDKPKMRFFDVDEECQKTLCTMPKEDDDIPAFDNSRCGQRIAAEDNGRRRKFGNFNFG